MKRAYRDLVFYIMSHLILVKPVIRYLRVHSDTRLSFSSYEKIITAGASITASALGSLIPNISGPSRYKRSLLMTVVNSRLLYTASIWAEPAGPTKNNKSAIT